MISDKLLRQCNRLMIYSKIAQALRQGSGAAGGNSKTSGAQDASKKDVPEDFDIDMEAPETEKAAVAIQSQFRKFQKKKTDDKS
ncbi:Calmodulin regulator protein PCP4 [Anabarilius grahami]|uniref:Calmodulin regulator protein PCP4 n=1 Tax=Anabarilius grahami TaxID=495550 RepID=A0A3N0YDC7_ANAGA|nr:Calmodulin regulator protein PCP4 [Anabarilius grahami]